MEKSFLEPQRRFPALRVVVFVAVVVALALMLVSGRHYAAFVVPTLLERADAAGVTLIIDDPSLHIGGFKATRVQAYVRRWLVKIELENVEVAPRWLGLVWGSVYGTFEAQGYKGRIAGTVDTGFGFSEGEANFVVSNLDLSAHPLLAQAGLENGVFSVSEGALAWDQASLHTASGEVLLENVRKPYETTLPGALVNSPMDIQIPAFDSGSVRMRVDYTEGALALKPVELASSLGGFTGAAEIMRVEGPGKPFMTLKGDAALTDTGAAIAGPWLPLISNQALTATTRSFSVDGAGWPPRFQTRFIQQ